ncbi:hypothetical protein P1X14_16665 [Sphingomonas sp. AOB5]|uniref:hypothetical protein n=1 Tax=Sphingomonas sp. AOB5 TaxID=3034017 RepID=UPI0023F7835F|nr:hypothetical protein [Sphingomonas sp. AOB5]MDF7776892.1 hypothetical protein [Sphingomonas sp. AOB5]
MNFARPNTERRQLLDEIAQVIGQEAVDLLISRLGGSCTYIPRSLGVHSPIAVIIGAKRAAKLAEFFHGRVLDLPKAHHRRQRALETALDLPDGMTLKDVALSFDYTERGLYKMLEKHKKELAENRRQHELFGLK